jgi:cytochrome c-type biogenesis protein CcmF
VRSGVLTSVHAFATDPERGVFILILLFVTIGVSLALFAWRAPKVGLGGKFDLVSRESMLLVNNVLLVVAAAAVMLGTLYPLLLDALELGKISVGPPYFNLVFVPLMAPAIFLMAIGPYARWKQAKVPELVTRLKWAAGIAIVMTIITPFIMGGWGWLRPLGFALAFWVIAAMLILLIDRAQKLSQPGNFFKKLISLPNSFLGMCVAHIGMGVFIIGVTMVTSYEVEKDMRMDVGDTVAMGGYTFQFNGVSQVKGPNYNAHRGHVQVTKGGDVIANLYPEKREYLVQTMPMTEAAIDTGLTRDLYVSLGEPVSGGAWSVRVYYKPFVSWIWGGCFVMALGGLLAATDRRYRVVAKRRQEIEAETKQAAPGTLAAGDKSS